MHDRSRFWMSRRTWLGASLLAALGLGAAGVATASPGWLGHMRHGFGHFRGGAHGPHAWGEEDIRFMVGWTLREVDASDEQVARVSEIAAAAAADLRAQHEAHRARREALAAALIAADREALERLRSQELATVDTVSRRIVTALADAADVLTPEQRQRLAVAHAQHHERE